MLLATRPGEATLKESSATLPQTIMDIRNEALR